VTSRWVYSEASEADARGKLLQVRDAALDPRKVPMPFTSGNITLVTDRAKIFAALDRRQFVPSNPQTPETPPAAPPGVKIEAPKMVVIPAGSFMMGSNDGEGDADEHPLHKVTIPQALAVGKYPVTFDEWDAAVAAGGLSYKPSDQGWGRGRRPVINVSWSDAQDYIKWLSAATGQTYRLLSEAEWEYACRAGTATAYSAGDSITGAQAQLSSTKTVEVGSFPANAYGLHDMHGNVWEWCEDCWNATYDGAPSDGSAWTAGDCAWRVLRGGSWNVNPSHLRSANRVRYIAGNRDYYNGFRVARTLNL
jgi:formylglycine-generating enzyme required for sulfatase activity